MTALMYHCNENHDAFVVLAALAAIVTLTLAVLQASAEMQKVRIAHSYIAAVRRCCARRAFWKKPWSAAISRFNGQQQGVRIPARRRRSI